jgi:hypothetical protein
MIQEPCRALAAWQSTFLEDITLYAVAFYDNEVDCQPANKSWQSWQSNRSVAARKRTGQRDRLTR